MVFGLEFSTEVATLVAALIGGLIGSIGTYYGQSRLQAAHQSKQSDWLRKALVSELESMEALSVWPKHPPEGKVPFGNWLHNQVFTSVSLELGSLESDELDALIRFHGSARHVRSDIESLPSDRQEWNENHVEAIQDYLIKVKRYRKAALHMLSEQS